MGVLDLFVFFCVGGRASEVYALSLHDALPICVGSGVGVNKSVVVSVGTEVSTLSGALTYDTPVLVNVSRGNVDRKSTRLNSSHANRSYAVYWLERESVGGSACEASVWVSESVVVS